MGKIEYYMGMRQSVIYLLRAVVAGLLTVCVLCSESQAKWVWTPETGWMNAKATPKASAEEQFKEGMRLYEKKRYDRAYTAFAMVRRFYPEYEKAAEADFLAADCLFRGKHYVQAYAMIERLLTNNPDSEYRAKAIEKEIDIGKKFLAGARKEFIGLKLFPAREKGIEAIEKAIGHDPFHKRVPGALMILAETRYADGQYAEAKKYYEKIVKEHRESELLSNAEYGIILCDNKSVPGVDYDTSGYRKVEKKCLRLEAMDDGEIGEKAAEQAASIRNRRARKEFEIGEFYRKKEKNGAALIYYKSVVAKFEDTEWAEKAGEWIEKLSGD